MFLVGLIRNTNEYGRIEGSMNKLSVRVLGVALLLSFLVAACPTIAVLLTPSLTEPEPVFVITIYQSDPRSAFVVRGIGETEDQDHADSAGLQFTFDERSLIEADWSQRRLVFDGSGVENLDPPNWIFAPLNRFSVSFNGDLWAEGEVVTLLSAAGHDNPVLYFPGFVSQDGRLEMRFLDGYNMRFPQRDLPLSSTRADQDAAIGAFLDELDPQP